MQIFLSYLFLFLFTYLNPLTQFSDILCSNFTFSYTQFHMIFFIFLISFYLSFKTRESLILILLILIVFLKENSCVLLIVDIDQFNLLLAFCFQMLIMLLRYRSWQAEKTLVFKGKVRFRIWLILHLNHITLPIYSVYAWHP